MIRELVFLYVFVFAEFAAAQDINGRVAEDHSGSPLASVEVRVERIGATRLVADVETAPDGTFRLPLLPGGDYRFQFSKPNYLDTTLRFRAAVPPTIAVRLVRCGVIFGRVLDQQGHPVRGAVVYAMPKQGGGGPLRPMANQPAGSYAVADQNGQYRLFYLPPGEYAVAASYGASSMVLGMTGSASVDPAVGSGVVFYPNSARPQFLTIAGGEEYRDVNLNVSPGTFFSVSGKVDAPANPNTGRYWLTLASADQPSLATAATEADAQGNFRFEGIAGGAYYLFAAGPSTARNMRGAILPPEPYFARSRVEVVAQNVEGLVVAPRKGATAAFVMRASPEAKAACPESAQLTLTSLEDWGAVLERTASLSLKEQQLRDLAPARYQARLDNLGSLCYQASDVTVDMAAAGSENIVIEVKAAGAIRGKLVGAGRFSDFTVALLASETMSSERAVLASVPDAQGRFSFESLRPGKYYLAARPASASKLRWISDFGGMLQLEVQGGSKTDVELPAVAASEGENK